MDGTPYLAMSSEWLGVLISDVSALQPLDTLGFLPTGGWCQRSYIRGDTLWACMRGYGLVAYETDSLMYHAGYMNQPELLHIFTQFVSDVTFPDDTLIVLSTSEIYNLKPWLNGGGPELVDRMNIGTMETVRSVNTNRGTRIVAGLTNLLFPLRQVALVDPYDKEGGYPILDIDSTNSDVNGLFISNDTLFCGKKIGNAFYLAMYRVFNDSMILIDTVRVPGEISGIGKEGPIVVVTANLFWLSWYYVDGTMLVELGKLLDWNLNPQGVVFKNHLAYVADRFYGLKVYRISEPPEATLVAGCRGTGGWINLFGSTGVELGNDGTIYLSDFHAGVIIVHPFDSTLVGRPPATALEEQLIISPNPASSDQLTILWKGEKLDHPEIRIYRMDGRLLRQYKPVSMLTNHSIQCLLNGMTRGMYLLTIMNGGQQVASCKLVIP